MAIFPAAAYDEARRFWRFCGECVSTRQAADALGTHPAGVTAAQGHEANQTIRARIASLAGAAVACGPWGQRLAGPGGLALPVQLHLIDDPSDTWTHGRSRFDEAPRTPLPHRPAHRLFGRLQGQVGRAVTFLAADARSEVRTDRFGYRRIPGHTLWDLGVNGPVGAGFEAGLTFRNIFDVKDAQDAVQQPLPGRTWLFSFRFSPAGEARGEER